MTTSGTTQPQGLASFDEEAFRSIIGRNADHYLPIFRTLAAGNVRSSWNWSASLVTWCWLLHRKMWGPFFLYLVFLNLFFPAAATALQGVGVTGQPLLYALLAFLMVFFVIPGLLGDRWYYKRCLERMARAAKKSSERRIYLQQLRKRGGALFPPWFILAASVLLFGILAAVAIPAWRNYSQRAPISEAVQWGQSAMLGSVYHLRDKGELPDNLEELLGVGKRPRRISEARLDPQTGIFSMTLKEQGLLRVWISPGGFRHLGCGSPDIPEDLLPSDCRGRPLPSRAK